MLVPINRETDWTFSTEQGHLQLLLNFPHLARLIVIGDSPNSPNPISYNRPLCVQDSSVVEEELMPLLFELAPALAFRRTVGGLVEIPFLAYDDEVVRSLVLERCVGDCVGEMMVEDVELELENGVREFRRRLRFKRMPNLVQSQIRIRPKGVDFDDMEGAEFEVVIDDDDGVLVHPYLTPMVVGLSVMGSYLDAQIGNGVKPKALCLGVGAGALLRFLSSGLGFMVLGVEVDRVVLEVARRYFGLVHGDLVHLCVGDAIEMVEKFASQLENDGFPGHFYLENDDCLDNFHGKFDVIMVDLDSSDARTGTSAPPLEFIQKSVLLATRAFLSKDGVVIINVIPSDQSSYKLVVSEFKEVFADLYEIDVGNGENFVLIASASQIGRFPDHHHSKFLNKLKQVSGSYMGSIRMI